MRLLQLRLNSIGFFEDRGSLGEDAGSRVQGARS
jgi:hypothetical protein